jgi:hypothetical protein
MATTRQKKRFLLCVRNAGSQDLELRKFYEQASDPVAEREGCVRVVDESGEDYLYPKAHFIAVRLPREAERACARRSSGQASDSPLQRSALARRR